MDTFKSSRNPRDLHPRLLALYAQFETKMHEKGIEFIVTCTYRNNDDQNALWAQGRTKQGAIVTNCRGGQSAHNMTASDGKPAACAFDIVILTNGKPDWNVNNPNWKKAGQIGKSLGLEWAGEWKTFKEFPHFQLPNWSEQKCLS